jgi:DNA helicase-2/ATP-dependent DNA helicase PcrA
MSFTRLRTNQKFLEEYGRLNARQQEAVDKIEGPVMVIAGPGTGKTQILAARIGKILLDTDAMPENILCLTYTEAGVVAMRRRLLSFIGTEAYKVGIYTYHGFCNEIIQENLSLFEKTNLDALSELERIEILKELIDAFPGNHLLKRYRGDVYYEMKPLQELFSTMKKEGFSAAFLIRKIDEYIESLPEREEFRAKKSYKQFKKGDLRLDWIEEAKGKVLKLKAAVNEFDNYQRLLQKRGRYDFEDMINWVLKAFDENKALLAGYQERYQYILVDEYQDTSGAQDRLVELLINYWENPNVFVVGDDDQSIYRFQGANIRNMEAFLKRYPELATIVLEDNYRSTQPILDIAKALIDNNASRLIHSLPEMNLTKNLISSNAQVKDLKHSPHIMEYGSQREEMADITIRVGGLIDEGVRTGKIAVIYKEHQYGEQLRKYLSSKGIAVYSKRDLNLLEVPLVRKILFILEYLAAEHDIPYGGDELLFEILHFDFFHIEPIEIAKLSVEVADKQFSEERTSMRRLLNERAHLPQRDLFDQSIPGALKQACETLEHLIGELPNLTLQSLVDSIVKRTGILNLIMESSEKIWLLQVLTGFFDFVKSETARDPMLDAASFIHMVRLMEEHGLRVPLVEISGSEDSVNLLTTHGAKGLEFEYVFFAGCNAGFWEKKRTPHPGYSFPDTVVAQTTGAADEEELRRLFYVAITRAERHLFMSYARFRNDGREMEPSRFLEEIREKQDIKVEKIAIGKEVLMEFEAMQFRDLKPEIGRAEEDLISRILDKFVLSVTALNNYLNCPLEFYFRNLIRIPSPKNEASEFGSAVHYALQQLFLKMKADSRQAFPSKEIMIQDFNWYMHRHRESFTREAFERRLEYGFEILGNYYDKYLHSWIKIAIPEISIRNIVINEVPIKGKLDKLEFNGREVNVVDYKTGDPENATIKLKGPDDKNPQGGAYWRQAVFYKILVDHYKQKDWKAVSAEFDFIEPDKKKEYRKKKVEIFSADIETVTLQIVETWQKIRNREFYTGCGKEDCHWCNFVKTNNMAIAMHEPEEDDIES